MNYPSVSIIVPVYNGGETLDQCLESLASQSYPNIDSILIIDNGSTDDTAEIASQYQITLCEYTDVQGSYAARNHGLEQVESDLVALTDADCIPHRNWIAELVNQYTATDADLVGGKIEFLYETGSAAEIYDASTSMNNGRLIEQRSCSVTANLLARRSIFDEIGTFSQQMKSGGDLEWTGRATDNGYDLHYCPEAIVRHPTRTLKESLKKHYRLGYGEGQRIRSDWRLYQLKRVLVSLLPRPIGYITTDLVHNEIEYDVWLVCKLFIISWVCRIVQGYGKISGIRATKA